MIGRMPQMLACKFGRVAAEQNQHMRMMLVMLVMIVMLVMLMMIVDSSRSADHDFGTASCPVRRTVPKSSCDEERSQHRPAPSPPQSWQTGSDGGSARSAQRTQRRARSAAHAAASAALNKRALRMEVHWR